MAKKKKSKKQVISTSADISLKSFSPDETDYFAEGFAKRLKPGDVVLLKGELGSGKTTFVKGIIKGLGIKGAVRSSSFILASEYKGKGKKVFHIDLYRLTGNSDFENLGLEEYIFGKNICIIEWADRIKKIPLPSGYEINFRWLGENSRAIKIGKI